MGEILDIGACGCDAGYWDGRSMSKSIYLTCLLSQYPLIGCPIASYALCFASATIYVFKNAVVVDMQGKVCRNGGPLVYQALSRARLPYLTRPNVIFQHRENR